MNKAYIDDFNMIYLHYEGIITSYEAHLFCEEETMPLQYKGATRDGIQFETNSEISLNKQWFMHINDEDIPVYTGKVVRTKAFDDKFAQEGTQFGATYAKDETTFKVWSPVATIVQLFIDDNYVEMQYQDGVWSVTLEGDQRLKSYMYGIKVNHDYHHIVDPYAKGLNLNSEAAVVVDIDAAPDGFQNDVGTIAAPADSIIYEVHVRDFTMHPNSGVQQSLKGKFLGLIEENTTTKKGFSTCFDYIQQLGITHVELLPINDFARVDDINFQKSYNWGYDPMFFQVPDGSYSVRPEDAEYRLIELKSVIQKYHEKNIGIIFDVVFNHVYDMKTSSFERLVPGYYFRYFEDFSVSNGTGVGNDFASERLMARKFIIDTLIYYTDYFKVDGFRFDLMGAIDLETMRQIQKALIARNPNMLLLGEGWNLNTALPDKDKTIPAHGNVIPHIHFFNDYFRDTLKGNNFDLRDTGYMTGEGKFDERIFQLFRGEYHDMHVQQSINYTEVHDNHTLYDRLHFTALHNQVALLKIQTMTTIFTILAEGIPFIHAGQEFFRTKHGHGNTYNLSDIINRIDWNRREKYTREIAIIQNAIALKREFSVFRMIDYQDILSRIIKIEVPHPVFGALLFDINDAFIVYFNPTEVKMKIDLPRLGVFDIALSNAMSVGEISGSFELKPFECIVLKSKIN